MTLDLTGLNTTCDCVGAACDTTANACGVHIHEGKNCTDPSGHFFTNMTEDPWTGANGAYYNNNESTLTNYTANLTVSYGYTLE